MPCWSLRHMLNQMCLIHLWFRDHVESARCESDSDNVVIMEARRQSLLAHSRSWTIVAKESFPAYLMLQCHQNGRSNSLSAAEHAAASNAPVVIAKHVPPQPPVPWRFKVPVPPQPVVVQPRCIPPPLPAPPQPAVLQQRCVPPPPPSGRAMDITSRKTAASPWSAKTRRRSPLSGKQVFQRSGQVPHSLACRISGCS